jgi:hypothetical protein
MNSDQLTKAQCAAIRNKASGMVQYPAQLKDRMDYKGFPADDSVKLAVVDAQNATQKLYREVLSRSIGVTGLPEPKTPASPPVLHTAERATEA